MPRIMRRVARTAVIAGTATAVSNRVSRRQANKWSEQEAASQPQQQYYEPPPVPDVDPMVRLKELAELKEQGILTEAEFTAEKAKILAAS